MAVYLGHNCRGTSFWPRLISSFATTELRFILLRNPEEISYAFFETILKGFLNLALAAMV